MAAIEPTNIQPTDAPPCTLGAPPVLPPPELFEEPDPPLPPPDPPPLAALAPTVKIGMAVPVNVVWNPLGPRLQTAMPLPSNEQVSWISSLRQTVAPCMMVSTNIFDDEQNLCWHGGNETNR
jgi:hypothetical protein